MESWGRETARKRYAQGGRADPHGQFQLGTEFTELPKGGPKSGLSGSAPLPPSYFGTRSGIANRRLQESERASGNYKEYYKYLDGAE